MPQSAVIVQSSGHGSPSHIRVIPPFLFFLSFTVIDEPAAPVTIRRTMDQGRLDSFWSDTLARSAKQPLEAKVEQVPERCAFLKYRVTYTGFDGIHLRAYLGKPILSKEKKLPVIVTAPGYSGYEFGCELSECQRGYLILQVFPRGQGESQELWRVPEDCYRAWLKFGKDHPEGFYYQGGFTDLIRGVDYLLSRDDADPNRVGYVGTSQGGGMVLSATALDPRAKAVVAHVPYLCDMRHNMALGASELGQDARFLNTFDLFDPVNLAPKLHAATLLSSGGKDKTCPPSTIRPVFDQLAGIKSLAHLPDLAHTFSTDFYQMSWDWMERYVRGSA